MNSDNLKYPLLFTRLSIAVFLLPWILMRFTKVEGAQNIAAKYYKISNLPEIAAQGMGVIWLVLLLAFLVGFKKRISYGLVLILHALGTLFTLPYLLPWADDFKILFMAAIPTIGAMLLLYKLRDYDTAFSLNK